MEGLTSKQQEDLLYLRKLDRIIIPKEFTYWCHSTMYKPLEDCKDTSDKRCWNEIPTNKITLKKEMSFVSRTQRINSALDYGNKPSIQYANTKDSLPFQIRALQVKHKYIKEVYDDKDTQNKHFYWERGLGDGRHPKLPSKLDLYVFAFSTQDDVSDSIIDIVYCIDKNDISFVADKVREISQKNTSIEVNIEIINNHAYENDIATIISKSNDMNRFFDLRLVSGNGDTGMIKQAGYKQDYKKIKQASKNK